MNGDEFTSRRLPRRLTSPSDCTADDSQRGDLLPVNVTDRLLRRRI